MAGKLFFKIAAGCFLLAVIGTATAVIGSAADLSDYEEKQRELEQKAQEYQSILDQTQSDIAQKEKYQEALLSKITVLNEQIANGRTEIASLEEQINDLQAEIDDANDSISDRINLLKQRVRAIYLSGETTSLEIILGAKDFGDFLDKLELVSYISNSDQKMINELESELKAINLKKENLAQKKQASASEQQTLNTRLEEIQELINENTAMIAALYEDSAEAQDHLDENTAEMQEVEDAILAYYADKAAQEEAARIASEAQKALEESSAADTVSNVESDESSNNTSSKTESSSSSSQTSSVVTSSQVTSSETDAATVTSSSYVWPVPGHYTLTSVWNEDRDTYNHGAIDISDSTIMNAEVVAAQSGTVVLSNDTCTHNYAKDGSCGCGGGYGNYLMIDHGDGKATLYAHLTSLTVSSGTYVQQGQVIGYVGSTGWSTGAHLHFETRLNGEKYDPMTEYPNM